MRKLVGLFLVCLRMLPRGALALVKAILRFGKRILVRIHRRKRYAIPLYCLLGYFLLVAILIASSGDPDYSTTLADKRVNDITGINPIQVGKEVRPTTVGEIIEAIRSTEGPISIGGGRYSMGGQTGFENSLHIDMRAFNKVLNIDTALMQVTVEPGIKWRALQQAIDPYDLSIMIMQTYADFTVGGSISVNCHGRYIGRGPIISSVMDLLIVTAKGDTIATSRTKDPELFNAVIGGYGGLGVIVSATLQLERNTKVERHTERVAVAEYHTFFNNKIRHNSDVVFQNGDLYPPDYTTVNNVSWTRTEKALTDSTRVPPGNGSYWLEPALVNVVSWGRFGKWIRRAILDPYVYRKAKVVWRNNEACYDVNELEPRSREHRTYVLQEYFIPVARINSFIPKMKAIFEKYEVNIINVSLRHAYPDHESYLSWAQEEVFAFVIYYEQGTDQAAQQIVSAWTVEITDAILSEQGSWYLPYQPHATFSQFQQGFPLASTYFAIKEKYDSTHRFTNKLLDKYAPYAQHGIEREREHIAGYYRPEEQTVLTVPEWYLVFNPKEFADYLEAGKNPSDFPYYASINEYWKLSDRSKQLVSEAYPPNDEYNTMLQVIGVSFTLEYTAKILYEQTVGRVFSWFATPTISDQEAAIIDAHRAYSDLIYHTAWYEFRFLPWVKKVWSVSNTKESRWLRSMERRLFFTMEFTIKAGYAQLIEWGAQASYEDPVTTIHLLARTTEEIHGSDDIAVVKAQGDDRIIGVPRWGAFTTAMLSLSEEHLEIREIGGNDEIVVSLLASEERELAFGNVVTLYRSDLVTDSQRSRIVCLVPVKELLPLIRYAKANAFEVEHLFDY